MRGYNFFIYALFALLIFMIYPGIDYCISFGWHTQISNEKSPETWYILGVIAFIILTYWLINREQISTNNFLTITHFLMTIIPMYCYLVVDELIVFLIGESIDQIIEAGKSLLKIYTITFVSILFAQILFLINIGIGIKNKIALHKTFK